MQKRKEERGGFRKGSDSCLMCSAKSSLKGSSHTRGVRNNSTIIFALHPPIHRKENDNQSNKNPIVEVITNEECSSLLRLSLTSFELLHLVSKSIISILFLGKKDYGAIFSPFQTTTSSTCIHFSLLLLFIVTGS